MESKRVRTARALDEFEQNVDEQIGLPLRKEARTATHTQNTVSVNIRDAVAEYAQENMLDFEPLFAECMALLKERMEKAVNGLCDEYEVEPFLENHRAIGQKLTYYKFGRRTA